MVSLARRLRSLVRGYHFTRSIARVKTRQSKSISTSSLALSAFQKGARFSLLAAVRTPALQSMTEEYVVIDTGQLHVRKFG
jgi:hypothetical protein